MFKTALYPTAVRDPIDIVFVAGELRMYEGHRLLYNGLEFFTEGR